MHIEMKVVATTQEDFNKLAAFLRGEENVQITETAVDQPKAETAKEKKAKEAKLKAAAAKAEAAKAEAAKAAEGITLVPGGGLVDITPVADITPAKDQAPTTPEMVREIARELIQAQKGAMVTEAIKSVGASSLSKVPEDKLTEVYNKLRELRKNG